MGRHIAVSDLHGCNQTFLAMLDRLAFSKADTLYILGDYVDRGPDSKGVIDSIWKLEREGYTLHCLMGNHEELTLRDYDQELKFGPSGMSDQNLLRSFGVEKISDIPSEYVEWMRQLPKYREIPGYILVHAGLDFYAENPLANEKSLLWIRNWYYDINYEWLGDRIVVHGHTPMAVQMTLGMFAEIEETQVLDIDCGAVFAGNEQYGRLCAFDMSNRELIFQENIEGVKI